MSEVKTTLEAMKKHCEEYFGCAGGSLDCPYLAQCQAITALHLTLKVFGEYYTKPMYVLDEHDITDIDNVIALVKEVFGV